MKKLVSLLFGLLMILPVSVFAVDCSELTTDAKIKAFVKKTRESNPLLKKSVSTLIESSPCEKSECSKKKKKIRRKKKEIIHMLRQNEKKRFYFVKGPNSPQCMVEKGKRKFICSECGIDFNDQCRSYQSSSGSNVIKGTNIDMDDFERIESPEFTSVCKNIPGQPKYLKIIATRVSGNAPYDKIVNTYNKDKEVPFTMQYYNQNYMQKIYKFFPKYYINLDGEWISTALRVRTTQGSEKKYVAETTIRVLKQKKNKKKFYIYLNPEKDPDLKKIDLQDLYSTN